MKELNFKVTAVAIMMAIGAISITFTSCQKDNAIIDNDNSINHPSHSEINLTSIKRTRNQQELDYMNFAKSLSIVDNNSEVRNFLISEALKELNGDYEILYSMIKNHTFSDGEDFETKIIDNSEGTLTSDNLINYPLLSINMPVNIDMAESVTPFVVYTVEHDEELMYGFTNNQQSFSISGIEEPNNPYWVVRDNERYNEDGTLVDGLEEAIALGKINADNPYADMKNTRAGRGQGDKEILWSFKVPNLKAIESWGDGCPEIKVTAVRSANGGGVEKTWQLAQYKRKVYGYASWLKEGTNVCNWKVANQGPVIVYNIIEDDGGGTTSNSVTVPGQNGGPSTTVAVAGKSRDKQMGTQSVWNTDYFQKYNLGFFGFYNQNVY